jgi:hypothetical protein
MAGKKSNGKPPVGGGGSNSGEKDLSSKEQSGIENKSKSDDEVRKDPFGIPGLDPERNDIILSLYINSLAFSTGQALISGIDREGVANIGLGYFVKLYDSLLINKSIDDKRKFLSDIIDLYLLTVASTEGGVS